MRITKIEAVPVNLSQKDVSVCAIGVSTGVTEGILVKIHTDDGAVGLGWTHGNPWICGETQQSIHEIITTVVSPLLVGRDPFDTEKLLDEVDKAVVWNYRAKAGVDLALHHLLAESLKIPVYKLIGGCFRDPLPAMRMIMIKKAADMAREAADLAEQGYKFLKVKVGIDPDADVENIAAIRGAVGSGVTVMVDANGGYSPKVAIQTVRRMQKYDIAMIEQPVRSGDIDGLAMVRRAVDILVEVDEGVRSPAEVMDVLKKDAADFVSIKMLKSGGIRAAKRIAALCEAANVKNLVGAHPGSNLLEAAAVHFIASTPNIGFACELGESLTMLNDPAEGLEITNGMVKVPSGPGWGIRVDM